MNSLSQKANAGTLTIQEQEELDSYERVGHLISIAQSKSRNSLRETSRNAIAEGIAQMEAGDGTPIDEAFEEIRDRLGLPDRSQ